ncbi:MAG: hypothetical protein ABFD90_15170 [Phycisphaerales bacterium]
MTSEKKAAANQADSPQSPGPQTQIGKTRVSKNAVKHGLRGQFYLIAGEDRAEFQEFSRSLHDQLAPIGALEEALAERIIGALWRLRRIHRIEVEMIDAMCEDSRRAKRSDSFFQKLESLSDVLGSEPTPSEAEPIEVFLGDAVRRQLQNSDVIGKFHRYEAHIERGLFNALHQLQRLQTVRQGGTVPASVAVDITAHLGQAP